MIIRGPRLRMRPIALGDYLLVAETFRDWPPDGVGTYTLARAIEDTDLNVRTGIDGVPDLETAGQWTQTLVLYTDDTPAGVGIVRHAGDGRACRVLQQAVHPAHRGRGYFSEANLMLEVYAFGTLGADSVDHELLDDSAPARAWVAARARYSAALEAVDGQTGPIWPGRILRADWEAWAADNPTLVPAITLEV